MLLPHLFQRIPGRKAFRQFPGLPVKVTVYADDFQQEVAFTGSGQAFEVQAAAAEGKVRHKVNEVSPQEYCYHLVNRPADNIHDNLAVLFGDPHGPAAGGNDHIHVHAATSNFRA
jgi:hypothetical protein